MTLGYCITCGVPLSEFEMCSYDDICMSCYEKEEEEGIESEGDVEFD